MNEVVNEMVEADSDLVNELFNTVVVYERMNYDVALPAQQTAYSAGHNIEAYEDKDIQPMSVTDIRTGLKLLIPIGLYGRIGE